MRERRLGIFALGLYVFKKLCGHTLQSRATTERNVSTTHQNARAESYKNLQTDLIISTFFHLLLMINSEREREERGGQRRRQRKQEGRKKNHQKPTNPHQPIRQKRLKISIFFERKVKIFSSMADCLEEEQETPQQQQQQPPPASYMFFLRIMSKRRTWVCIFVMVYAILLLSSWNFLKSILSWYKLQSEPSSSSSSSYGWPALYASVLLGAVFGLMSMVAALAVLVPATLVTWIAIVVLLAFFGKPRKALVVEGRKITREIVGFVIKILLKEGNFVAAVCAVLGYFALVRKSSEAD